MSNTHRDHPDNRWLGLGDEKHGRDKKPRTNPAGWFKRMWRRIRRRRANNAFRAGQMIERDRNNDRWDWN